MPLTLIRLLSPYGSDRLVQLAARLRPALCDTLIVVEGQEFPAHSLVLAGVSQQLGCRGQWALVEGISPSTFAQVLSFVYGESIELQPGELGPLEEAARALGVQALEEACRSARRDKTEEGLDPGLKKHQEEPEKTKRDSERELGDLREKRNLDKFFRFSGTEQETRPKHKLPRERPEMTEAIQEDEGAMRTKEKKLNQVPAGDGGRDGKQRAVLRVMESLRVSEEHRREFFGPLCPPGSLQTRVIPRTPWAEAPWPGEGQPALWRILLWPPRYGTPFSCSTPITAAWQEVWPREQRIPLTLSHPKVLWSQNQLVPSSPTPGSRLQYPVQLSLEETEEPGQGHTGERATYMGKEDTAGGSSRPHPPLPSPARTRPHSCSVCGKRFSLKHQMETHYRVHTGEKPFSCSLCPQRSRDFSAMTKHLRTHGAAPYRCPLCGAGRPSLASMQTHMRSHSPNQLPPGWTIRSTFLYSSSSSSSRLSRAMTSAGSPSFTTT
ncbi:zinc finger and BTB domain-containing protein 32 [Ctenodactylus gundi]